MNKIILITGPQGSGKSTRAREIAAQCKGRSITCSAKSFLLIDVGAAAAEGAELVVIEDATLDNSDELRQVTGETVRYRAPYSDKSSVYERPVLVIISQTLTRDNFAADCNIQVIEMAPLKNSILGYDYKAVWGDQVALDYGIAPSTAKVVIVSGGSEAQKVRHILTLEAVSANRVTSINTAHQSLSATVLARDRAGYNVIVLFGADRLVDPILKGEVLKVMQAFLDAYPAGYRSVLYVLSDSITAEVFADDKVGLYVLTPLTSNLLPNDETKSIEREAFKAACLPLIKYLADNHHPHTTCIVTNTRAELLEGTITTGEILDFIKD